MAAGLTRCCRHPSNIGCARCCKRRSRVSPAPISSSSMPPTFLDAPTRSGLFSMLGQAELSAVVCMTLSRREQVPDLARAGLGESYWLDDGVLEPLHLPGKAEAA